MKKYISIIYLSILLFAFSLISYADELPIPPDLPTGFVDADPLFTYLPSIESFHDVEFNPASSSDNTYYHNARSDFDIALFYYEFNPYSNHDDPSFLAVDIKYKQNNLLYDYPVVYSRLVKSVDGRSYSVIQPCYFNVDGSYVEIKSSNSYFTLYTLSSNSKSGRFWCSKSNPSISFPSISGNLLGQQYFINPSSKGFVLTDPPGPTIDPDNATQSLIDDFRLSNFQYSLDSLPAGTLYNQNVFSKDWRNFNFNSNNMNILNSSNCQLHIRFDVQNISSNNFEDIYIKTWARSLDSYIDNNQVLQNSRNVYDIDPLANDGLRLVPMLNNLGFYEAGFNAYDFILGNPNLNRLGSIPSDLFFQIFYKINGNTYSSKVYNFSLSINDLDIGIVSGDVSSSIDGNIGSPDYNPDSIIDNIPEYTPSINPDNISQVDFSQIGWDNALDILKDGFILDYIIQILTFFTLIWAMYPTPILSLLIMSGVVVIALGVWRIIVG